MLLVFRSKAHSDIRMLASHARELLAAAGKDAASPDGVFTTEQIAPALAALAHYSDDYDQRHPSAPEEDVDDQDDEAPGAAVPMRARAQPLMAMLRAAQEMGTFVTWHQQTDNGVI